jgi:hypothetical protein
MSSEDMHSMMHEKDAHTHFSKNAIGNIWKDPSGRIWFYLDR